MLPRYQGESALAQHWATDYDWRKLDCPNMPGTKARVVDLSHTISAYGYWAVGGVIALESMGLPLPGETMLIAAAIYAGSTHQLDIGLVILAAIAGAIIGDNIGFILGREVGYRLLLRYGRFIGLTEQRIKLGQYLFERHGGKIVFVGRFITILRAVAAFLAGVNRMRWQRFLLLNAAGGIVWALGYGLSAYWFGAAVQHLSTPIAIGFLAVGAIGALAAIVALRNQAKRAEP
jgi:membrane protein DedA with SNARE-associated domain